jgi:uncharacterized ion transporter superfamily protein YfcC
VDTFIVVVAGIFAVVMMFMLPKYARFINNQPKQHMEIMRQKEEEEKAKKKDDEPRQD